MRIVSTAFSHQSAIPALYTCEGKDISPPMAWVGSTDWHEELSADCR